MPRHSRSFTSIPFQVGAKVRTRTPGLASEPTIHTTLRRIAAAAVLLPTLLIATPAAAKPAPDSFSVATLVDHTARVQAVAADRASRLNTAVTTDLTAVNVVPLSSSGGGSSKPAEKYVAPKGSGKGATIARWAAAQAGKAYRFGATGPSSFDCSGLSQRAAAQVGIKLPHNAAAQFRYGRSISRAQLQPGDLIFWRNNGGISHVAVSLGGNAMVHAANPRTGVKRATIYGSPAGYRRIVG